MKKIIFATLFSIMMVFSGSLMAQSPPHPNGGNTPGATSTPVGGGAPIDGGISILIAMGLAYGVKKVYNIESSRTK